MVRTLAIMLVAAGPAFAGQSAAVRHYHDTPSTAAPVMAMPQLPAQNAFAASPQSAAGCIDGARLASQAAFVPGSKRPVQCGHYLSTDTLLSARKWDRT